MSYPVSFSLQLITTEKQFLKNSLYKEGILIVWDPSLYHADIPSVSEPPICHWISPCFYVFKAIPD